ncbi:hypothetical protein HPSH_07180 [Helicobacter pylori Shi470]|nr:hypothetical protein HPSH_05255 [Helicobacter pylori Shi470]ACD48832.1 hypothetical protein HPSH_07180 [Helicobacter pylori Shi470]
MHVYNYISFLKTSFKKFFNLKQLKRVIKAKKLLNKLSYKAKKLLNIKSSLADKTWQLKKIRDQAFLVFFKGFNIKSDYSKFLKKNEVI